MTMDSGPRPAATGTLSLGRHDSTAIDPRRALPKTDVLLALPVMCELAAAWGRPLVAETTRRVLDEVRRSVAGGGAVPSPEEIAATVAGSLAALNAGRVRSVINATGVVLHTNLGRAPLSEAARAAVNAAAGYSTVEFDLATGGRGKRGATVNTMLRELSGAPGALAVNNAAAALFLALGTLARDREVIVSRGELVEIGGEFRIPAIMEAAGARLVEVGSTNRTHVADYVNAVTDRTAMLMVVHPSNYRIEGFTAAPPLPALVSVAREAGLPLLHDLGSGLLTGRMGDEPTLRDSLAAGTDLAVFSGDKLFGGPQAGIVVGDDTLVRRLSRHPIARAVRIDKLTLAALEATLLSHLGGRRSELPVWRMLDASLDDLTRRATRLAGSIGRRARVREGTGMVGGGSLPAERLPSVLVELDCGPSGESAVTSALRAGETPVIVRTERGRVLVDLRTVAPEEDEVLEKALLAVLA
ncbi:L-seryl-tRNA(Sec) selenium transferase [Streptosporangium sp. NPDC049046]|uniref:L-seryl-tRNA(Sec) selenium transferase n=1 Tax=Streptosporangium sp. NPDC049046 TaxID=3155031 RepID=UPI00341CF6CE